jgi:hypothetical protein
MKRSTPMGPKRWISDKMCFAAAVSIVISKGQGGVAPELPYPKVYSK